jgi:hypothetical protein
VDWAAGISLCASWQRFATATVGVDSPFRGGSDRDRGEPSGFRDSGEGRSASPFSGRSGERAVQLGLRGERFANSASAVTDATVGSATLGS